MASVGMIHLACYCGAELFYLGEKPEDLTNSEVIDILKDKLGPGDFGVLTPSEDLHGECPYCGLIYELPDPRLLKHLPYAEQNLTRSAVTRFRQTAAGNGDLGTDSPILGRYVS
jgi:hypothetical protein